MNVVVTSNEGYSPDVEIDADGKVKYARDIKQGELIRVPLHMLPLINKRDTKTPS